NAADLCELRAVDLRMVLGPLAIEPPERRYPREADRAEHVEHHAPAVGDEQAAGRERRDGNREAAEVMRDALDAAALRRREPELHAAARHRKRAGLADAEEDTRGERRVDAERRARGQRRRRRPR